VPAVAVIKMCRASCDAEFFTTMKIQVEFFWTVTPCSVVVGYQLFRGPCYLYLCVVTPCSVMVGYQHFRGSCCLRLLVVTPCSVVVG
jgi:hypothetical protein